MKEYKYASEKKTVKPKVREAVAPVKAARKVLKFALEPKPSMLKVCPDERRFVFNGKKLDASANYAVQYIDFTGQIVIVCAGRTTPGGNLNIVGEYTAPIADLLADPAPVFAIQAK